VDRLSHLLRQAGARGTSDKHRLMRHAADTLDEVEIALEEVTLALDRGDRGLVRLRLKLIAKLLGCEQVVMDDADNEAGG
jgi:hypothetical protein